jgi:apoptosis-inducing factor 3
VDPHFSPRTLPVAGFKSSNVYVLRDIGEAHAILEATKGKNVLVVGSSFIGMETAASVVTNAASVTVIGMERVAFERVLGVEVGSAIQKMHEAKKIKFIMEAVVKEMKTSDDQVTSVVVQIGGLAPGTEPKEFQELECDVVVVGVGVVPATNFIKPGKSIKVDEREKSIYTDNKMHAGNGIYAAGDIARYPLAFLENELARIEHWGMAQYQGLVAAHNMVGKTKVADAVPFFWTAAYGKTVRYAGHALRYDEIIIDKEANGFNADTLKFAAYYCHKGKVLAVATLGRDPLTAQCAELMQASKMPSAADLQKAIAAQGSTDALIQSCMK